MKKLKLPGQKPKPLKKIRKKLRRAFRFIKKKEVLLKIIVIVSSLAMIATTILPYVLG